MSAARGTVYLVGAGPGDPGLLTVRGAELLATADVVVYDGLVGDGLLEVPGGATEMIYAGKKRSASGAPHSQAEICSILVERARAGRAVVRLKGGDPMVFGRASEELDALADAGVPFEIVPGVSSLTAVPAYAGVPLTRRGVASTVAFATGHAAAGRALTDGDFSAFAHTDTIVLFMAVSTLSECTARLIAAGRDPATPAMAIHWGTTASQRTLHATLGELAEAAAAESLRPPALVVIGDVTAAANRFDWRGARELAGVRVLVPRPRDRAQEFAAAIAALGGEPLIAPLTRLVRAPDDIREPALAHLAALSADWVLFSSASAVEFFTAALLETGGDLRRLADAKIGCVGESTARALRAVGLRADLVPGVRSSKGLAEAVLAAGPASAMRVAIIRAHGGRRDADDALAAAGAKVTALPLYHSQPAPATDPAVARALARLAAGELDVVPFFAPSQVSALFERVGDGAADALAACRVVAAIGETTARALRRRGVRIDVVASRPDAALFARDIATAIHEKD